MGSTINKLLRQVNSLCPHSTPNLGSFIIPSVLEGLVRESNLPEGLIAPKLWSCALWAVFWVSWHVFLQQHRATWKQRCPWLGFQGGTDEVAAGDHGRMRRSGGRLERCVEMTESACSCMQRSGLGTWGPETWVWEPALLPEGPCSSS